MTERFRFASDDDGHDFLIPADKAAEFETWVFSEAAMDGEPPPAWARPLGRSHEFFTFTDPQEGR